MAIAVTTQSAVATAASTSVTITKPTGLAVGDLLVAHLCASGNSSIASSDWTVPSGWTRDADANINYSHTSNNAGVRSNMMYKVADSSDAAATNFSFTFGASTNLSGVLFRVTGQRSSTPLADANSAGTASESTDTSPTAYSASVTPTIADSLIMIFVSTRNGSGFGGYAISTSDPGGWTEAYDSNNIACAYVNRTQTTGTGTATITWSGSNVGNVLIVAAFSPSFGVTVSADLITSTSTVQAPTVTGGASVSVSTITSTGTVQALSSSGQADWSPLDKADNTSWSSQAKS